MDQRKKKKTDTKTRQSQYNIEVDLSKFVVGAKPLKKVESAIIFAKDDAHFTPGQLVLLQKTYPALCVIELPKKGLKPEDARAIFYHYRDGLPTLIPDPEQSGFEYLMKLPEIDDYTDVVFHPSARSPYLLKLFAQYAMALGGVWVMNYDRKQKGWKLI